MNRYSRISHNHRASLTQTNLISALLLPKTSLGSLPASLMACSSPRSFGEVLLYVLGADGLAALGELLEKWL